MHPLTLTIQLQQEYAALHRLVPAHGPTALAFIFTNIKILLLELSHAHVEDTTYVEAWSTLNREGMIEFDRMLEAFGDGSPERYSHSFICLKSIINEVLPEPGKLMDNQQKQV